MHKVFVSGLILGKFSPFHEGHKLMIDYASDMCEVVHVLVNSATAIPIATRVAWLKEQYKGTNVFIHHIKYFDGIPEPEMYDDNGTAIDDKFWDSWIDGIHNAFIGKFDAVFSNDCYGEVLADRLNAVWMPVDSNRTTQDISGSAISANPMKYYNYLTEVAKPYYQKTIAVVGPESTGKSLLAKSLAVYYDFGYAHEYGRTLSEIRNNSLSEDDFYAIGIGQERLIASAHKQNPVVVTDTEAFTTYLYSEVYLNQPSDKLIRDMRNAAQQQKIDLYILLAPTVKWHNDGTRVMGSHADRQHFFNRVKEFLDKENRNYVVVDDEKWDQRTAKALLAIPKELTNVD